MAGNTFVKEELCLRPEHLVGLPEKGSPGDAGQKGKEKAASAMSMAVPPSLVETALKAPGQDSNRWVIRWTGRVWGPRKKAAPPGRSFPKPTPSRGQPLRLTEDSER